MDPNLQNVILSLIANGLSSLIAKSTHKAHDLLIGKEFLEKWELEKTSLEPILQKAIVSIAENVEWNGRPAREEVVCLFLLSPEVEEIVRQIYSMNFEAEKRNSIASIRMIFLTSFAQFVTSYHAERNLKEDQLVDAANFLLDALIKGCNFYLEAAIDKGILAAHEAQSVFRYNIIQSEIKAIQRKLDFIVVQQQLDILDIFDSEKKFRQQIANRHGYITPPNFDSARKLPIDNLYVCPDFATTPFKENKKEVLSIDVFLSRIHRAVLLGNPGGGKSTLTLKICYDLATHYSQRLFAGRKELTPILVVLRNYGTEKKERRCSIREFIETEVEATYQLSAPPDGTFEYLFQNGRAVLIFDGLDELLDTSYRQEIRDDVQSFCNLYPSVPVLVTSREVGYEQAPLDERMFEVFRLEPFNDKQVEEYVVKWFDIADTDMTPKQRQQKKDSFLKDSQSVPDLRSNPLMLALMCNIYRGENYIPRNRPDVYEKCATMLFDRWDKSRNIRAILPFEAHIRPTMIFLAHWIYTTEGLRNGVTERNLITKAADYLHQKRFEDPDEAERAAQEFIHFCQGRAWIFTDTGTEKGGERLYQFTHQTFLEYFTAAYLVRTHPTPETLMTILQPKIAKREWDMVCQLSFQILNKNSEDAGDKLLSALTDYAQKIEGEKWINVLSFSIRCLNFIIPSPPILKDLIGVYITHLILVGTTILEKNPYRNVVATDRVHNITTALTALPDIAEENLIPVISHSEKLILKMVKSNSETQAVVALEVIDMLRTYSVERVEARTLWEKSEQQIFNSCSGRLEIFCSKSPFLGYRALIENRIDIGQMIKWHGINSLFIEIHNLFGNILYDDPVVSIIRVILNESKIPKGSIKHRLLKDFGQLLLSDRSLQVPRLYNFPTEFVERTIALPSKKRSRPLNLDIGTFFGIFIVFSILFEFYIRIDINKALREIETNKHPFYDLVREIFISRFKQVDLGKVQGAIDRLGFSPEQQDFIRRWVKSEISLVQ